MSNTKSIAVLRVAVSDSRQRGTRLGGGTACALKSSEGSRRYEALMTAKRSAGYASQRTGTRHQSSRSPVNSSRDQASCIPRCARACDIQLSWSWSPQQGQRFPQTGTMPALTAGRGQHPR
eukprot:scaffold104591_cov69-Phaeocystis_antarctica.AAC.2